MTRKITRIQKRWGECMNIYAGNTDKTNKGAACAAPQSVKKATNRQSDDDWSEDDTEKSPVPKNGGSYDV